MSSVWVAEHGWVYERAILPGSLTLGTDG